MSEQALRTASTAFIDRGTSLETRVGSIEALTTALTATWTGAAATSYTQTQTAWNKSGHDEAASLTSIGKALTTMADNLVTVEDAAKEVWPA